MNGREQNYCLSSQPESVWLSGLPHVQEPRAGLTSGQCTWRAGVSGVHTEVSC